MKRYLIVITFMLGANINLSAQRVYLGANAGYDLGFTTLHNIYWGLQTTATHTPMFGGYFGYENKKKQRIQVGFDYHKSENATKFFGTAFLPDINGFGKLRVRYDFEQIGAKFFQPVYDNNKNFSLLIHLDGGFNRLVYENLFRDTYLQQWLYKKMEGEDYWLHYNFGVDRYNIFNFFLGGGLSANANIGKHFSVLGDVSFHAGHHPLTVTAIEYQTYIHTQQNPGTYSFAYNYSSGNAITTSLSMIYYLGVGKKKK